MAEETEKEALITLDFSGIEKKFADIDELREFMQSQWDAWSWLEQAARKDSNLAQVWDPFKRYFVQATQFIEHLKQHPYNLEERIKLINIFKNQTQTAVIQGFILAETPEAHFILELKDNKSPQIAGYALTFLNNSKISTSNIDSHEGAYWTMKYLQGSTAASLKAQQIIYNAVAEGWTTRFEKQHKELGEKNEQLDSKSEKLAVQSDLIIKNTKEQAAKQASDFNKMFVDAAEELAVVRAYNEESTPFKASIKYWNDKHKHHRRVMFSMAFITLFTAITTAFIFATASFIFFTTTPNAKALTEIISFGLITDKTKLGKILFNTEAYGKPASDKTVSDKTVSNETKYDKMITRETTFDKTVSSKTTSSRIISGITPGTISGRELIGYNLWRISIMLLISTLGIWLTRLSTKIFISSLHLGADAYERVTMIRTYIALLVEDKELKDDDRKLILQTLFRPVSTNFVKDDGPSNIPEIFVKTVTRR